MTAQTAYTDDDSDVAYTLTPNASGADRMLTVAHTDAADLFAIAGGVDALRQFIENELAIAHGTASPADQAHIEAAWGNIQGVLDALTSAAAQHASLLALATTLRNQRDGNAAEFANLVEALVGGDTSHPLVHNHKIDVIDQAGMDTFDAEQTAYRDGYNDGIRAAGYANDDSRWEQS
jgi:hypothetical protein